MDGISSPFKVSPFFTPFFHLQFHPRHGAHSRNHSARLPQFFQTDGTDRGPILQWFMKAVLHLRDVYLDVNPKIGVVNPPKWMVKIMENPINKWDDLGGKTPLFLETPRFVYLRGIYKLNWCMPSPPSNFSERRRFLDTDQFRVNLFITQVDVRRVITSPELFILISAFHTPKHGSFHVAFWWRHGW